MIDFLDKKKLQNNDINYGYMIVNVIRFLKEGIQLMHASKSVNTFS